MRFFLLCALFISPLAFATEPEEVCAYDGELNSFVNSFFDSKCLAFEKEARCECFEEEKSYNKFLETIDSKTEIQKYRASLKEKRESHFWTVYTDMIHGAAYQKEFLFPDSEQNESKVVGCPASEMSGKINKNILEHLDNKKDIEAISLAKKSADYEKCLKAKKDCSGLAREVNDLQIAYDTKKSEEYMAICDSITKNNNKTAAQVQLESAKAWVETYSPAGEKDKKLNEIECHLIRVKQPGPMPKEYETKGCAALTGLWDLDIKLTQTSGLFKDVQGVPTVLTSGTTCTTATNQLHDFLEGFDKEKLEYLKSNEALALGAAAGVSELSDCKGVKDNGICKSFDNVNKSVLESKNQEFHYSPKNCISYPEYLIKKGVPGDAFMQALAATPDGEVAKFLEVPAQIVTEADRQRVSFLRSNPLIAKMAIQDDARIALAKDLKQVALKSKVRDSSAVKLDAYIQFMKKSVQPKLTDSDFQSSQQYLCERMIKNYTAIQISTDLPPMTKKDNELPLFSAVRDCEILYNNLASVSESRGEMEFDKLFTQPDESEPELSDIEKFNKLNEDSCKEYPAFAAKNCGSVQNEVCRKEFLKTTDMKEEQVVYDQAGTARQFTQTNFESVAKYSKDSAQDTSYKSLWSKKIGSRLSKNSVAYKGSNENLSKTLAEDNAVVSGTHLVNEQKNRGPIKLPDPQSFTTPSIIQNQTTLNPGQITPSFQDTPVAFLPEKLAANKSVISALPEYEDLSQEEKIEGLSKVKNYLEENEESFQASDLQRKIAETQKLLDAELKAQKVKKQKYSSYNYKAPNFSKDTNQASPVSGPLKPSAGNSSSSFAASGTIGNTSKGQSAVNDALNSIDKNKISSPTKISKDVIVRSGAVSENELKGQLVLSQELVAASEVQFKELSSDPKALELYLQAQLKEQDIGEGRLISIIDPGQKVPARNLIFRVVIENGRYIVQSIPTTVKVERTSTLEGLKLNLKSIN